MSDLIPKVIIFDIGGVVLGSPFQAIAEFETFHDIPSGYINFAISTAAPNGAWQRLERGEIPLDTKFFNEFRHDLESAKTWAGFLTRDRTLDNGKWQDSQQNHRNPPKVDAEQLFWSMMMVGRNADPYIYPAVQRLKQSGQFIIVALSNTVQFPQDHFLAEDTHNFRGKNGNRALFDIIVSSAHIGMRKPEPAIYDFAMKKIQELARDKMERDIEEKEVLFLDDIGANLRPARSRGWGTIKVDLGQTMKAVNHLEKRTKMSLMPVKTGISKL